MIATGLVFLLGALVATLLALLFVPFLWRNAQRLARRDFAATMPATMSEIRSEVDRVRAEAAMTVRRHEMLTRKARERLALERASVGRLTATNAEVSFLGEQRQGEANALRAQIDGLQQRVEALEETRLELEQDNAALREALAQTEADVQAGPLPEGGDVADERGIVAASGTADRQENGPGPQEPEQARITAATSALLALARDYRRDRGPDRADAVDEGGRSRSASAHSGNGDDTRDPDIANLMTIAREPVPADPGDRRLRNANVRERIAELASRFLPTEGSAAAAKTPQPERSAEVEAQVAVEAEPSVPGPRKTPAGPRAKRRRGSQRNRSQPPR